MRRYALLYINGQRYELNSSDARMMLSDFLRYKAGLTGTKVVCAEGDCGACTVLRSFPLAQDHRHPEFQPINACIVSVAQMDCSSLVTVEGLSGKSPIQVGMVKCHGSQCGFCTPGIVMALTGLVEKKLKQRQNEISEADAKNSLTGNLCRCTGYKPILQAAAAVSLADCASLDKKYLSASTLQDLKRHGRQALHLQDDSWSFRAPTSFQEASRLLAEKNPCQIVGGGTDLGVQHNKWKFRSNNQVSFHLITSAYKISKQGRTLTVGTNVSLARFRDFSSSAFLELSKFLDLFASPQIKNLATLAGNIANASPIADLPPALLATNSELELFSSKGTRRIMLNDFYKGYKKTALRKGECITSIRMNLPQSADLLVIRKVSERKDLDISIVNSAFFLSWQKRQDRVISEARFAFGGLAATPIRLKKSEAYLKNRVLDQKAIEGTIEVMQEEISPISDLRGSSSFRRISAENLLRRFLTEAIL